MQPLNLPVSRKRALIRGVVWSAGALALGLCAAAIASRLDFRRTGVHSLLVETSLALIALPFVAAGLAGAVQGVRYLLLAAWAGVLGVRSDDNVLTLHLGPFGVRHYPVGGLDIKYPFELSGDEESFEAFLPEETQRATMLPRILHPTAKEPIQRTILRFAVGTEAEIAMQMRAWLDAVRDQCHSE